MCKSLGYKAIYEMENPLFVFAVCVPHTLILVVYPLLGSIRMSDEVSEAKYSDKPIVALESTIITHGMPYPENVKYVLIN